MAPPPDTSDPAPSPKHKKKNKSKRAHSDTEEETVTVLPATGQREGNEERRQGGKDRTEGNNDVKKKKKKKSENEQITGEETIQGTNEKNQGCKKRKQGDEKVTRKKRKSGASEEPDVMQAPLTEEELEELEALEVQTPPTQRRRGEETRRKKKERKGNKELQLQDQRVSPAGQTLDIMEPEDSHHHRVTEAELVELEEFIPDVRTKAADVVLKMKRYDLPRLRNLKSQGLKVRWGRFTYQENIQIRKNVEDFLKLTGIETVDELFFPSRYPDREQSLRNLRGQHGFYQKLADGLLRTSEQVYIRGKKIFDRRNNLGRFSKEEVKELEKLHTIHGNDWKTISNKLDRSIYACEKRCSTLGTHSGPWTLEETQRFHRAVKKHLKLKLKKLPRPGPNPGLSPGPGPGLSWVQLCSNLPWAKISHKVQTRSSLQCRVKWFTYLKSRINVTQPKRIRGASVQTRIRLIQTLYEQQINDVFDLDWVDIAKSVGGLTPMCAQRLFHRIKVSHVPGWSTMSFGEMVDVLFEKVLPELQNKLQTVPTVGPGPGPDPDHLSLDLIFPKDQEEFMELDNS